MSDKMNLKTAREKLIQYSSNLEYNILNRKNNEQINILTSSLISRILNKYINKMQEEYLLNTQKTYLK